MPRAMSLRGELQYCGFLRRTSSKALTLKRASRIALMACRRPLSERFVFMGEGTLPRAGGLCATAPCYGRGPELEIDIYRPHGGAIAYVRPMNLHRILAVL